MEEALHYLFAPGQHPPPLLLAVLDLLKAAVCMVEQVLPLHLEEGIITTPALQGAEEIGYKDTAEDQTLSIWTRIHLQV